MRVEGSSRGRARDDGHRQEDPRSAAPWGTAGTAPGGRQSARDREPRVDYPVVGGTTTSTSTAEVTGRNGLGDAQPAGLSPQTPLASQFVTERR